jgi:hypothetical protein
MQRHTDQLYRLAELPAFIEEALSNVSLKDIMYSFLMDRPEALQASVRDAVMDYAEQWVDDWMARHPQPLTDGNGPDHLDAEIRAIEAGVKLFSNPDCKAGLPE